MSNNFNQKSITLLHISDFHFKATKEAIFDQNLVLEKLIEEVKKISNEAAWAPELVLCTGDLAFSGKTQEYFKAAEFFQKLSKGMSISPQKFYIVPGNHDIDLSVTEQAHKIASQAIELPDFEALKKRLNDSTNFSNLVDLSNRLFDTDKSYKALTSKFNNYSDFLRQFKNADYDESFCFADIYLSDYGLAISLIGLNSALLSEGKGKSEYGGMLLGLNPLLKAFTISQKKAEEKRFDIDFKIVAFHHPTEWLYEPERGIIKQNIAKRADIVLEGHQNNPQQQYFMLSSTEKSIFLQEGPAYEGSHWPNRVQFIRLVKSESRKTVEVKSIVYDTPNAKWISDMSTFASHGRPDGHGYFELWENPVERIRPLQISHWQEFYTACHKFEEGRSYILIIGDMTSSSAETSFLGRVDWGLVFDFDPSTEIRGTFSKIQNELKQVRSLHLLTLEDKILFHPEKATYWIAAQGLEGRPSTIVDNKWREWNRQYSQKVRMLLEQFAHSIGQRPTTIIVLWHKSDYIRSVCEAIDSILGNTADFVFATTYTKLMAPLSETFSGSLIPITMPDVCRGLDAMITPRAADVVRFEFPTFESGIVCLSHEKVQWLQEELELIHLGVGKSPSVNSRPGYDFYRGLNISWFELLMHFDVERDRTSKICQAVEQDLASRHTRLINLYHWPGAGGTTVARRVAWDLHEKYPVVILRRSTGDETVTRLRAIYDATQLPMLVVAEAAEVEEAALESLYSDIIARPFPVVFLHVVRRFQRKLRESERVFFLDLTLTISETARIVEVYSREVPEKRRLLEKIEHSASPSHRNPFYFALVAFEKEFKSLEDYVQKRIKQASADQIRIITYIALAYNFAQKPLSLQLFNQLLGLPPNSVARCEQIFSEPLAELLFCELENNECRPIHQLVAEEILQQVLSGNASDRRIWVNNLSLWAKDFALLCSNVNDSQSCDVRKLLVQLFIDREQREVVGTDLLRQRYAELIEKIPSLEGRLDLLKYLTELFPSAPHFWAHYGRFIMMEKGDYDIALFSINNAISLDDTDFVLYHIKGMIVGKRAINKMDEYKNEYKRFKKEDKNKIEEIKKLVENAGEQFEKSRLLSSPEREHAYVSHIVLLLRTVDFGFSISGFATREDFLASNKYLWFLNLLDISAGLLHGMEKAREGEAPSSYMTDCGARLLEQYGEFTRALKSWTTLLSRQDIYHPPIRRNIAYTYLAKAGRNWENITKSEIEVILNLMERNLQEEPRDEKNIRLWFEAARRFDQYSIDTAIERLTYWKLNSNSIEAIFYLYILYSIQAIEGSTIAMTKAKVLLSSCSQEAKNKGLRIRTNSLEWLGKQEGLRRVISSKQFERGKWDEEFETGENLSLVTGRIAKIISPAAGEIELSCGLFAFFVPSRGYKGKVYYKGLDENKPVQFYLAFSYDSLRAWAVRDAEKV